MLALCYTLLADGPVVSSLATNVLYAIRARDASGRLQPEKYHNKYEKRESGLLKLYLSFYF
jgi:hypothetical protein